MTLKPRLLLIAVGVGCAVQVVIFLISIGTSLATAVSASSNLPVQDALAGVSFLMSTLACFCPLLVDVGTGLLYSWLHTRQDVLTTEAGLIGGLAAGGLTRLVISSVGICLGLLVLSFTLNPMAMDARSLEIIGGTMGIILIAGMLGIVISVVAGVLLGALGGAIGVVVFGQKQNPSLMT